MKILLAVDGSRCSNAAVASVAARPWPEGSEIKLLAVTELHLAPQPGSWFVPDSHYLKLLDEMQTQARAALEQAEAKLRAAHPALTITAEIVNGIAKEMIVQAAEQWPADLLVLGSHGHGAVVRFLLGSVSLAVASHVPCSVEIIRCPAAAA
jgi:nucleotide-binding universal stress UspA family protein